MYRNESVESKADNKLSAWNVVALRLPSTLCNIRLQKSLSGCIPVGSVRRPFRHAFRSCTFRFRMHTAHIVIITRSPSHGTRFEILYFLWRGHDGCENQQHKASEGRHKNQPPFKSMSVGCCLQFASQRAELHRKPPLRRHRPRDQEGKRALAWAFRAASTTTP